MLIDTDVLIWMARGHAGATTRLQALVPWRISAVTYMELAQGCRNKQELERTKKGLSLCRTEILPVSATISDRAVQQIERMPCGMVCSWVMRSSPPPPSNTACLS